MIRERERNRRNLLYIPPSCVTTSRVLKFLYPSRHGRNQPSMHPRNAGNFIRFPWSADSRIHHALSPRDGGYFHSIFARQPLSPPQSLFFSPVLNIGVDEEGREGGEFFHSGIINFRSNIFQLSLSPSRTINYNSYNKRNVLIAFIRINVPF